MSSAREWRSRAMRAVYRRGWVAMTRAGVYSTVPSVSLARLRSIALGLPWPVRSLCARLAALPSGGVPSPSRPVLPSAVSSSQPSTIDSRALFDASLYASTKTLLLSITLCGGRSPRLPLRNIAVSLEFITGCWGQLRPRSTRSTPTPSHLQPADALYLQFPYPLARSHSRMLRRSCAHTPCTCL